VNSPVRAFGAVGGEPYFVQRAAGCRVWDADGREYVDWVSSWGAILVGHADARVVAAVARAAERGTSYGAPTPGEVELAERIVAAMPGIERLRFTSSGTEAAMSAVRLARAFTDRAGIATLGIPGSAGVTGGATRDTIVLPYNDAGAVERAFAERGREIAGVVVEPVAANMGVVAPAVGFLEALRRTTAAHGALLVFDEVITGFRVAAGGAAERFGVTPDLWCLGKVIGGGLPVGAFGGRADVMAAVAPEGPMYQAGTLSGNPLAMAAGSAALERLAEPGTYEALEAIAGRLAEGLAEAAGEGASVARVGPLLTVFFAPEPPADYAAARSADTAAFARFFHAMLDRGVALPPSQFEAWFPTLAHDDAAIDATLAAAREAFAEARAAGAPA
jgi:glutamate-1-semialdehyde 2,1-aminomutase